MAKKNSQRELERSPLDALLGYTPRKGATAEEINAERHRIANRKGVALEEGTLLDDDGNPVDPNPRGEGG